MFNNYIHSNNAYQLCNTVLDIVDSRQRQLIYYYIKFFVTESFFFDIKVYTVYLLFSKLWSKQFSKNSILGFIEILKFYNFCKFLTRKIPTLLYSLYLYFQNVDWFWRPWATSSQELFKTTWNRVFSTKFWYRKSILFYYLSFQNINTRCVKNYWIFLHRNQKVFKINWF